MKDADLEIVVVLVVLVALSLILLCAAFAFKGAQCSAAWEGSGMKNSWGPLKGCVVQLKDGTWIPSGNYRQEAT